MKTWQVAMLLSLQLCPALRAANTANLIRNGDAEGGVDTGCSAATSIPQWTTDGGMGVCSYTTQADWQTLTTPGPANRGMNFFAGAYTPSTTISQVIDLATYATDISTGGQAYTLRGYLGGWLGQDDNALVKVTFRSAANAALGTAQIGPVLAADRGNATLLMQKTQTGALPAGTRSVLIELTMTRTAGSANDGAADNLEFFLGGGAVSCNYSLAWIAGGATLQVPAAGGDYTAQIATTDGCAWTSQVSQTWLRVTSATAGSRSGTITVHIDANSATETRSASVTVAGRSLTVNQAGTGAAGTQELAGWWKLDESSGTAVSDSSGLGNHGRVVGTPSWTSGSSGGALSLDGSSYVEGTSVGTQFPRGSAARTITAWVKMNPVASDSSIFHYGDTSAAGNLHLYIGSNGRPGFGNGDRFGTIAAASTVTDNAWHHVAGVYEGSSTNAAKLYVDGALQGSGTLSTAPNTGSSLGWRIGSFLLGAGKIKAVIDDVRLYTRALGGDEIRTLGASTGTFPPQCEYTVAPTSINASLAGGTYQAGVATAAGCAWSATSSASWITFGGASSGTGGAIVRIVVAANGGSLARTGTVTIAGTAVTVTQAANTCEFTVRGSPAVIPGEGAAEAAIALTASAASCPWSVSSNASWVTILRTVSQGAQANSAPFSGSGTGTAYMRVDANPGTTGREGAVQLTLGGSTTTYYVRQDPLSCSLTLDRYRDEGLSTEGGESRTISVNLSHSLCRWKADTLAAGVIAITPTSGTGSGRLTYTTKTQPMGNPALARITFCSFGTPGYDLGCRDGSPYEKAFEVKLEPPCTYSLSPDRVDDIPPAGAEGSFGVRTNYPSCEVTGTSNASWIKILPPYPPTNLGWGAGLNYRVEANTSTNPRSGTISVSKQNLEFRVSQQGVACAPSFIYDILDLSAAAYSAQLDIRTNGENCAWTVRVGADATDWLKITGDASGRGNGRISFSVAENKSKDGRAGALIVGAASLLVRQDGTGSGGSGTPGGQTGGDSGKVGVDQNCNIYGAGHKTPPASSKGAPGILPVEVKLPANSAGKVFVVTKATASTGAVAPNGFAHDDYYMLFKEVGGLSAIKAKAHVFLTGVFLDDSEPSGAAPEMLVFRPQLPYFASLRPGLRQVFFIGDGQNDGKNREFVIPAGATRLFLGTTSGYSDDIVCCFDRSGASWSVEYAVKDGSPRPAFDTVAVEFCYNIYGAGHQQTPAHPRREAHRGSAAGSETPGRRAGQAAAGDKGCTRPTLVGQCERVPA